MKTLNVVVGSNNPAKINAARQAFEINFSEYNIDIKGVAAPSGVADQPMNEEETSRGASNRVSHLCEICKADYYIAYEGGVDVFEDGPRTFAVVCISNGDSKRFGQSAALPLPITVYQELLRGEELGDAMDKLFDTKNIKQRGGAIGQLTRGKETRASIYTSATLLALAPFNFPELY
ncbi:MAG: inosine/xanthosine triphosphatase [Pseudomonadota bacterium]